MAGATIVASIFCASIVAGCMTGPSSDPSEDMASVDLGAAEDWTLAAAPFAALECATTAVPSASAEATPAYNGSLADFVRATASTLGANLEQVTLGNQTLSAGDVTYQMMEPHWTDGVGAPPRLQIRIDARIWPGGDEPEATIALERFARIAATETAWFRWDRLDDDLATATIYHSGGSESGWIGIEASRSFDPDRTSIHVKPWYRLGDLDRTGGETRAMADDYASCAHPGAEIQHRTSTSVQYGSATVDHLARIHNPDHHCAGPAWWISVDPITDSVLSERPVECY